MNFSDNTFEALQPYERYFSSATRSNWCQNPGRAALTIMADAVETIDRHTFARNFNCGTCLVRIVKRCGSLYFADKAEREKAAEAAHEAAAASEAPKPTQTPAKKKTAATAKKTAKK